MNYFRFFIHDQVQSNWLIFTEHKDPAYVRLKRRYSEFVCSKCVKLDHDKVFKEGFDDQITIRAKGNFLSSEEGFYCFDDSVKRIIEDNKFLGLEFKQLPNTKWYVINVCYRVKADETAYTYSKQVCETCGRSKEVTGLINLENEIQVPNQAGTFFGPVFDRGGSMNGDRDLFATGDIVVELKRQGIRGGTFEKLLKAEDEIKFREAVADGKPFKWPKGSKIIL